MTGATTEARESTEADRLELAVLARPHTEECHDACACELESPPE